MFTRPASANSRVPVERPPPRGREGRAAVVDDPGKVGHRLDVVDDRRLAVETSDRGEERRLDAREAALALEGLDQRGLLAADVGAGPGVHDDVEGEVRTEDLATERAMFVGVVHGLLDPLESEREFAAQKDESEREFAAQKDIDGRHLQRVGRDDDALDQLRGSRSRRSGP